MGRNVGDENERWPVSGRVAAGLDRKQQLRTAVRRIEEGQAIPRTPAVALPSPDILTDWNGPILRLLAWRELVRDRESTATRQAPDSRERESAVHQHMMLRGKYRRLAGLPDDWRAQLDKIESHFPNFAVVFDSLCALFAITEFSALAPHLDPLLLNCPSTEASASIPNQTAESKYR